MTKLGRALQLVVAGLLMVVVNGCPQLLEDDFVTASGGDASLGGSAGSGGTGAGGSGGVAGLDGGPDADPCASCTSAETCCDGVCANLLTTSAHCGECNKGCPGTACVSGQCSVTCVLPFLDCDQNVVTGCEVNAAVDTENCGGCNVQCGFDATCDQGVCKCPGGTADCNSDPSDGCETDRRTSFSNCGACGKSCGPNQLCATGTCACVAGFADCNMDPDDGCEVDLGSNSLHCGACGESCGVNGQCGAGVCGCTPGFLDCDTSVGCEAAVTSATTCGGCNTTCSTPTPSCDGTTCVSSCGSGQTLCGASCVFLQTDPLNCGGCGQAVGTNQVCVAGTPTCMPNFGDCTSADGCETDLTSSKDHCNACNNACKPGAVCSGSACSCAAGTPNDCGAECRACCNNDQCSDGNPCTTDTCTPSGVCESAAPCAATGNKCCAGQGCYECCGDGDCSNGQVCSSNQCVTATCTSPQILCSTQCVDPTTDAKNCGGCGNDCGVGRTCVNGDCTPKWVPTGSAGSIAARSHAAYAFIPSLNKVFIWGGIGEGGALLATGALYDVGTNTWAPISNTNAPDARALATAVWTGTTVVVWGGGAQGSQNFNDGGQYDPATNSWTTVPSTNAPEARRAAFGAWTGSKVLIWSGYTNPSLAPTESEANLYDPVGGEWTVSNAPNQPPRLLHAAVTFRDGDLHVYGGRPNGAGQSNAYFRFRVSTNSWTQLSNGPSPRYGAFGGHDGERFSAWGGRNNTTVFKDGQRLNPAGIWVDMAGAPGSFDTRFAPYREQGFVRRVASGRLLYVGGLDGSDGIRRDAALYNLNTGNWTQLPSWGSHDHRFPVGVWTGSEFVLWGGTSGNPATPTNTGVRLRP